VQSVSAREGLTNFAFTVHRNDFNKAQKILKDICHDLKAKAVQSDSAVVSSSNARCNERTANSKYFSSITTDILISLVEII
jgi:aspartate kinase